MDNVYLSDSSIIKDVVPEVRVILSYNDISTVAENIFMVTSRRCGAVVFYHGIASHAEKVSEHFFGKYERLLANPNIGTHGNQYALFTQGYSDSISIQRTRDLRLDPEFIRCLPAGEAFGMIPDYGEGRLILTGTQLMQR